MGKSSLLLSFLFLSMMNSKFILHSSALQFVVGGRDGWVFNPKENYDHWAQRLRFQVNDTLLFRYSNATDSVLAVSKNDYDNCNVNNPVIQLYGGNSGFVFGHSGTFYFITGNKTNCETGQKLLIVVLAVRTPPASPTTPPASSPTLPPSATPTPSGSVAPGSSPASSPEAQSPASSPEAQSPGSTSTPATVGPGGGNAPATPPNGSSATATFTPAVSTLAVSYFFIMALGWSIILQ